MGNTTDTARAIAIAKAATEFPVDKLVAMAGSVGWLWRGKPVTRDDALNTLQDLVTMLLEHEGEAAGDYTAGFSYQIKHWPKNEEGDEEWVAHIRWGIDGEGSADVGGGEC